MNYRHAFHAGNFADVLKHVILCRVLVHLRAKPAAFRVIDTHAGAGLYDLAADEAARAGEWRNGIGRLRAAPITGAAAELLAPYLDTVARFGSGSQPSRYPGSPLLAQALLRAQDRLVACEVEPGAAVALARVLARDRRCKALRLDGWTALRAQLPPKERRGVVLIDPPFEQPDEFVRLRNEVAAAHRKWPTGIMMLWYPVKDRIGPDRLAEGVRQTAAMKLLRVELMVEAAAAQQLRRCGVIVINPPWLLEEELGVLLPVLAERLSPEGSGAFWLAGEK